MNSNASRPVPPANTGSWLKNLFSDTTLRLLQLERRIDPSDRRTKWLHLTPRGQAALAAARQIHQAIEHNLAVDLGVEAVETLREVLAHVVDGDARAGAEPRQLRLP